MCTTTKPIWFHLFDSNLSFCVRLNVYNSQSFMIPVIWRQFVVLRPPECVQQPELFNSSHLTPLRCFGSALWPTNCQSLEFNERHFDTTKVRVSARITMLRHQDRDVCFLLTWATQNTVLKPLYIVVYFATCHFLSKFRVTLIGRSKLLVCKLQTDRWNDGRIRSSIESYNRLHSHISVA